MQENEKTYERDIYMEERNEELEMSADTELKKKLRFRHLKTARRLQQIQSLKKRKDLRQISAFCFLPEYTFSIQVISSAQTC